jgi:hypothetical protein
MTGSVRLTADGVVGPSGKPIRVFNVVMLSAAGGAGELVLRSGTADTGTAYVTEAGTAASKTKTYSFEGGLVFPSGCFFDKDANTDAIVANFEAI